jgi:hypothetical protein
LGGGEREQERRKTGSEKRAKEVKREQEGREGGRRMEGRAESSADTLLPKLYTLNQIQKPKAQILKPKLP